MFINSIGIKKLTDVHSTLAESTMRQSQYSTETNS